LTFWLYVKEHLNRHELQRFYSLRHISSELGRGRAWLRCALNEHSLERYLHTLLADRPRLNSILFAINIDNSDLNGAVTRGGSTVSSLFKESTHGIGSLLKESTQGVSTLLREISTATAVVPGFTPKVDGASDPLPVLPRSTSAGRKRHQFLMHFQNGETTLTWLVVGSLSSVSTCSPVQVITHQTSADILIPINPADPQPVNSVEDAAVFPVQCDSTGSAENCESSRSQHAFRSAIISFTINRLMCGSSAAWS
ncbi:hypothetical protein XENOCAPTIV_009511, partial [Xenoophorus captivus]